MSLNFRKLPIFLAGVAVALMLTGTLLTQNGVLDAAPAETIETTTSIDGSNKSLNQNSYAPAVQKVMPSVVNIFASRKTDSRPMDLFANDPVLRRFFGEDFTGRPMIPRERLERSLGSGVIVSSDGYILTNNHVVEGGSSIRVSLGDKREFDARIVGTDNKSDLAVLKVDVTGLPAVSLNDSPKVQVGDVVLAIGNPFGVGQTVTMGIVSATGRGLGIEDYEDFIQTDAAINPGNSGGALISADGRLVGINTAILSRSGGNQGIGFAIPAGMARNISDQLIKSGKVSRAFLGVMIQPVTADLAKAFKLQKAEGALISEVSPNSPAERSGLKAGDVVTKFDSKPVADSRALQLMVGETSPGRNVNLTVVRSGSEQQYAVTLGEQPGEQSNPREPLVSGSGRWFDGVVLETLNTQNARSFAATRNVKGVVVRRIDPESAAAKAGLEEGDLVVEVNRQPVSTAEEVRQRSASTSNDPVLVLVQRDGRTLYLAISAS